MYANTSKKIFEGDLINASKNGFKKHFIDCIFSGIENYQNKPKEIVSAPCAINACQVKMNGFCHSYTINVQSLS